MFKAKHPPTGEQLAVVDAVRGTRGSVMVDAYAGCAKTYTLTLAAQQVKVPALGLAFNKSISLDMKAAFPGNFAIKTMNGLGMLAWGRRPNASTKLEIDDRKLGKLVTQIAKDRKIEFEEDQWDMLRRLVTGAMLAGIVPIGSGPEGFLVDTRDSWRQVADSQFMSDDDFETLYELAREVLEQSITLAKAGVISFDDQVYCSVLLGGRFPQFPVTFVDEKQDLSALNHAMLRLSTRPDGRLVAVGDDRQGIYAFRGAHGRSSDQIRALRPEWTNLLLPTTFRCPKVVVARQQSHAPGFNAWHTNAEGLVKRLAPLQEPLDNDPDSVPVWTWAELAGLAPSPGASIVILCRNNGPLLSIAFKLIRQGVGPVMQGRDIGKGLVTLSRKIAREDGTPADTFRGLLDDWETTEKSKAAANDDEGKIAGIIDRAECLRAVLDGSGAVDAGQLRSALGKLFAREHGDVRLSTIHRFKGLEADVVCHLDPWRLPSRWARDAAERGDGVPLEQEYNLRYVCETRTRHTLAQASLDDFR